MVHRAFPIQTGTDQFTPHGKCLIPRPRLTGGEASEHCLCVGGLCSAEVRGLLLQEEENGRVCVCVCVCVCVYWGRDSKQPPLQFVSAVLLTPEDVSWASWSSTF